MARAALLLLARALALGREALCSVAPQPPPRQRHPLGLAFVKLQVRIYGRFLLCCPPYYLKHLQQICISLVIIKERKGKQKRLWKVRKGAWPLAVSGISLV